MPQLQGKAASAFESMTALLGKKGAKLAAMSQDAASLMHPAVTVLVSAPSSFACAWAAARWAKAGVPTLLPMLAAGMAGAAVTGVGAYLGSRTTIDVGAGLLTGGVDSAMAVMGLEAGTKAREAAAESAKTPDKKAA